MENKSSTSATVTAGGNINIQDAFKNVIQTTIKIDASQKTEELLDILKSNRSHLKDLKNKYSDVVQKEGGLGGKASIKRNMFYNEILRTWGAMEALKNELVRRGVRFDLDEQDNELPETAYNRIMKARQPDPFGAVFWYLVLAFAVVFLWFLTW